MPKKTLQINGNGNLPTAKDFSLPSELDLLAKKRIETSQAVLKNIRENIKNEQKSQRQKPVA
jgi:hypothetical protein